MPSDYDDDGRVLVVLRDQPRGHPWMWLGVGTGVLVGILYFLRGSGGGLGLGGRGLLGPGTESTTEPTRLPRDDVRLTFVMTAPTDVSSQPASFRGPDSKAYSISDLVARIKAGGRTDVALKATGAVLQGAWQAAKAAIKAAGIDVWEATSGGSAKTVGSSTRGTYR